MQAIKKLQTEKCHNQVHGYHVRLLGRQQYYSLAKGLLQRIQVWEMMSLDVQILSMMCLEDTQAYMSNRQFNIFSKQESGMMV